MSLSYADVIAKYEPVFGLEVHVDLLGNTFPARINCHACIAQKAD